MKITLSQIELASVTGYEQPTKQLQTLRERGFYRAYIARQGGVILERAHYEAVARGEDSVTTTKTKVANLKFMRRSA